MSRLEDKFRERLLGHLSDANTEVDVRIAVEICKQEMLLFLSFLRENYSMRGINGRLIDGNDYTSEKLLEKYLKL